MVAKEAVLSNPSSKISTGNGGVYMIRFYRVLHKCSRVLLENWSPVHPCVSGERKKTFKGSCVRVVVRNCNLLGDNFTCLSFIMNKH